MAGKRKKEDKVVALTPSTIEEQFEIGEDPREYMSSEQIAEFIRKEEEQLSKRIGKFAVVPKPDTSTLEEEEDGEIFTLDLEKKTIEQKIDATIVGDEGLIDKVFGMAPANPYTDLITSIFVSRALANLLTKIKGQQDELEDLAEKAPTSAQAKALGEVSRTVYGKQIAEIRACWVTGTNKVKFDKVPEWASTHINQYIEDQLRTLITFVEE